MPTHALMLTVLCANALGCAHQVLIETEPKGARVFVDGELAGTAPIDSEQRTSSGGRFYLRVEADGYEPADAVVAQTEWFLWPALLAGVPLIGIPLALPLLLIPGLGLLLAPAAALLWAVVTSPTIASIAFTRRYPDHVQVRLKRKALGEILSPDVWVEPEEAPNPPPLRPEAPAPPSARALPPQPEGGNPVP